MNFYLAHDSDGKPIWLNRKDEALKIDKGAQKLDIKTDQASLIERFQAYEDRIFELQNNFDAGAQRVINSRPVAVTLEEGSEITVLARFDTLAEAEDYLATSATVDPDRLEAGLYGIDAPEEMVNPVSYAQRTVEIDEIFENLPVDHQLHLAALAIENARNVKCQPNASTHPGS